MTFQDLKKKNKSYHTKTAQPEIASFSRSHAGSLTKADLPVLPEILFITSYPPRECGIATYSQDLMLAMQEKFDTSFSLKICAIEAPGTSYQYPEEVKYILPSSDLTAYENLATKLNMDENLSLIFIQHEFGLFSGDYGQYLLGLLCLLTKPVITTFHTVLPAPDAMRKKIVQSIAENSVSVIAMTVNAAHLLEDEYGIPTKKISIVPHGTHLVSSFDHTQKKARNHLGNRMVLTTFGLLSSGKSIETALDALPAIIDKFPNILYLIIGKTHPGVVAQEGERYRDMLQQKALDLNLQSHVRFINKYLSLPDLLGYLQRTDIYLFTSKDPYQAVSGTFAYAMGCGCPVISTPIPHAKELLAGAGLIVDFQRSDQFADATIKLLSAPGLMRDMKLNALHKIRPTAWPNAALAHARLITEKSDGKKIELRYNLPRLSLAHMHKLTTPQGIIQFSKLSAPHIQSGYTLDDNARALIAMCKHYQLTRRASDLTYIQIYLDFIIRCQQGDGTFLNYIDADGTFNKNNNTENLEDANGRALWALGEFIAYGELFNQKWIDHAESSLLQAFNVAIKMHSPRAMAFVIKGLYHYNINRNDDTIKQAIISLAKNLASKYKDVSDKEWKWFEKYLTYANSVLPEAMLCAYLSSGIESFKTVAKSSFGFLNKIIFQNDEIKVVSNQGWLTKGKKSSRYGEQPIDVAYTILALARFHTIFPDEGYRHKMEISFNWFLGKNHLQQIMYNPSTGGCYDGLEERHINLNQGAESTVSYLLSRLMMEPDPGVGSKSRPNAIVRNN